MKATPLQIPGAWVLDIEPVEDPRGFFARTWCRREVEALGLQTAIAQCSISQNRLRGTLRGMHFQAPPGEETKIVGCVQGAIFDVILDLRDGSPTQNKWQAVELRADTHRRVFVPAGCAHGFQTLADDTVVSYQISEFYDPELARGIRWDDPAFAIAWPLDITMISERDRGYPLRAHPAAVAR